ncbi:hypothetical protein OGAPHI_003751 [Ogataea philodendri]|uniref:ATP-dependent DNA helicase CHL1 n=1 Tax=Ogataea philodendri TaxID=1378263 RepID=A0A9P8P6I6_9ASCO|nr:uncharacterized protein OGAPHI_003751 [Ogataea philodendri]KAH3665564.1 hypothetical protein OGAPHI_003751 [Ogataea philodendri]
MVEVEIHDRQFNHPYTPYDVQVRLMEAIYDTMAGGFKVGIFESPTGTGKTLSIICSTMTWLREQKQRANAILEDDDDDEPEWIRKAYRDKIIGRMVADAQAYERHLDELAKTDGKQIVTQLEEASHVNKHRKITKDEDLVPEDYYEDESLEDRNTKINNEIKQLMAKVEGKTGSHDKASQLNHISSKVYFSSRTHSQLSQFAQQLRLTHFPSSLEGVDEKTKYLALGSRRQLCINEKVSSLKDVQQINEACLDLQRKKDGEKGCQFMPKDDELTTQFRDLSFSAIHDIEELHDIGSHYKVCPYYGSRKGFEVAEIVSLPYQLLLQKTTRQVLGIDLRDSIVVIDEAHNLLDTISSMNSAQISLSELLEVRKALRNYTTKFSARLNAGNRINLAKLSKMITILAKFLLRGEGKKTPGTEIDVTGIFDDTTGDLLNFHSLETYLTKSKIAYKVESYMEQTQEGYKSGTPILFKIRSFLECLSNPSKSGKLFYDRDSNNGVALKYLLLDPSEAFRDVVEECKCVILAGGTMEPVADFTNFLVPYIDEKRIKHFNCDHIIPASNLDVYPVTNNARVEFEFSFDKRNDKRMISSLGDTILQLIKVVPDGMVVFFPSYKYLDQLVDSWKQSGLYERVARVKPIYTEPRESTVDRVLQEYSSSIAQKMGAVLFAVVGGKMSEGINFSDELARAVMMVGLPFPNLMSGDLIAKRKYVETATLERGGTQQEAVANARDFYENICMKAVNQSVGRAIRNIKDYSVIYLVDVRYERPNIQSKLSSWIRKRLETGGEVSSVVGKTRRFFAAK